jgi:hypothetical protein
MNTGGWTLYVDRLIHNWLLITEIQEMLIIEANFTILQLKEEP